MSKEFKTQEPSHKSNVLTAKSLIFVSSRPSNRHILAQSPDHISKSPEKQKGFLSNLHGQKSSESLNYVLKAIKDKELSNLQQRLKEISRQPSLNYFEEKTKKPILNESVLTIDRPINNERRISKPISESLKSTILRNIKKKHDGNNKEENSIHLNEHRAKRLNMIQIKDFVGKYTLKFTQGHSNRTLERCVNLLTLENDPLILENLFPGHYTMYIDLNTSVESVELSHSNSKESLPVLQHVKSNRSKINNGVFLPYIRSRRQESEDYSRGLRMNTDSHMDSMSVTHEARSMSMIYGTKKPKYLPKMDVDTFRDFLYFYQDPVRKSILLQIDAYYKESCLELGFCELVWDENKSGSVHMPKYYIQRMYTKMGTVVPITVKVIDYLFKTYNLEKITTDILPGNETMYEPLTLTGFKFERIFSRENKLQTFGLRKKDFYQWFQDVLRNPESYNSNSNIRFLMK